MSLAGIFNDIIEIYRYSSTLYSGEIAEVEITTDPAEDALIRVTLKTAQTGTIYLNGSMVETLSFNGSEYAESSNLFSVLSGVTPAGLSGHMDIETYDEAGEPVQDP